MKVRKNISQVIRNTGLCLGVGMIAGVAGTLAITLSQIVEMKLTKRGESTMPADAASKVLDVKETSPREKKKFSQEVHWAYGTSWGIARGLLSLAGVKGFVASAAHYAAIYSTALWMPPALKVAPPLKKWSPKTIAIDAWHHLVYTAAVASIFNRIEHEREYKFAR